MAIYKEDIAEIELQSGAINRSFLNHTIGSGDKMANRFGVSLLRNGEPVSVESSTVTGLFMAPDGTKYAISETSWPGSTGKEGSKAWVQLPEICYAVPGVFCLAIKLSGGGVEGTMRIVDGMVCETGETEAVVPTSAIPTTEEIIAAYEEAVSVMGGSVRFDAIQSLTDAEKKKARDNIEAVSTGEAAQTKGVIDTSVKNELYALAEDGKFAPHIVWEQGNIQDGADSTSSFSARVRTKGYVSASEADTIVVDRTGKPWRTYIYYYNSSKVYVESENSYGETIKVNTEYPYYRVVAVDTTGGGYNNNITPLDVVACYVMCKKSNLYNVAQGAVVFGSVHPAALEQGNIVNGEDSTSSASARVRTRGYISADDADAIRAMPASGRKWRTYIYYYDSEKTYVATENTYDEYIFVNTEYPFFRIVILDNTGGGFNVPIAPEDADPYYVFYKIDEKYKSIIRSSSGEKTYPVYFDEQMDTVIPDIEAHQELAGKNGTTFVFCTDLHWTNNKKNSPALIRAVKNNAFVDTVILGGDYIAQHTDKAVAMNVMRECVKEFRAEETYPVFGNHDQNSNQSTESAYMSKDESYAIINSWMSQRAVYGPGYFNFYIDDNKTKTRIVCIDTGAQRIDGGVITAEAQAWIVSVIDELPADWHAVIVAHWLFSPTTWNHPLVDGELVGSYTNSALTLFDNLDEINAESGKATVEAVIVGHVHCDYNAETEGGIPIVWTDTDSMGAYGEYPATANTVSEQCIDVITIDYAHRKIYCDRIGRGVSRTIEY